MSDQGQGQPPVKLIVGLGAGAVAAIVAGSIAILLIVTMAVVGGAAGGFSIMGALATQSDTTGGTSSCAAPGTAGSDTAGAAGLSAEQTANATTIIGVAKAAFTGESFQRQAAIIGIIVADQESSLINLNHGDNAINPDGSVANSLGLFQQQNSWGTAAQRQDPAYASGKFFQRLASVANWMTMDPGLAGQAVQISFDKSGKTYANHLPVANELVKNLFDSTAAIPVPAAVGPIAGTPSTGPGSTVTVGCSQGSGDLVNPLGVGNYTIAAGFGPRAAPCAGCTTFHEGIDMAGPCGTPVYAATAGDVKIAGVAGDYGNAIFITGDQYTVVYGHLNAGNPFAVSVNDVVKAGQLIGYRGNTGHSTGCHLHFEMRVGSTPVDPQAIFQAAGVAF
ncbi:hypothetical protein GCM10025867_46840 (plasmid) [Frondihabitans sucicola]|uniref:M23ase beta-sheet core domain-containing protein n=1 Tax=Frondihabitans sucicola TaxID=1268041 RepID=A0ABN6Y8X0_9MICO|nr:M23 family metallopeptidase [Frondihabitans sucicola]BDZ52443.1 hypothetical protein GCM10025867_46840 [Frondihabitans sucicola]